MNENLKTKNVNQKKNKCFLYSGNYCLPPPQFTKDSKKQINAPTIISSLIIFIISKLLMTCYVDGLGDAGQVHREIVHAERKPLNSKNVINRT